MAGQVDSAEVARRVQWMRSRLPHTLCHVIGMELKELSPERVVARLPVYRGP